MKGEKIPSCLITEEETRKMLGVSQHLLGSLVPLTVEGKNYYGRLQVCMLVASSIDFHLQKMHILVESQRKEVLSWMLGKSQEDNGYKHIKETEM